MNGLFKTQSLRPPGLEGGKNKAEASSQDNK
jgi:hypothetical protein